MNLVINFICMYNGYKVISCRQELISMLNKMKKLGYKWGSGRPIEERANASEIGILERSYNYGNVALVFSDQKKVYFCDAGSALGFVEGSR